MTIPTEAVTAATKAMEAHVKAHSVPVKNSPWDSHLTYAFNPSMEECLTVAMTAALPHLPQQVAVVHVAHDTEAHARSFNDGYETAVVHMVVPDGDLANAQDWFENRLNQAKAEALREYAAAWPDNDVRIRLSAMRAGLHMAANALDPEQEETDD